MADISDHMRQLMLRRDLPDLAQFKPGAPPPAQPALQILIPLAQSMAPEALQHVQTGVTQFVQSWLANPGCGMAFFPVPMPLAEAFGRQAAQLLRMMMQQQMQTPPSDQPALSVVKNGPSRRQRRKKR